MRRRKDACSPAALLELDVQQLEVEHLASGRSLNMPLGGGEMIPHVRLNPSRTAGLSGMVAKRSRVTQITEIKLGLSMTTRGGFTESIASFLVILKELLSKGDCIDRIIIRSDRSIVVVAGKAKRVAIGEESTTVSAV